MQKYAAPMNPYSQLSVEEIAQITPFGDVF